MTEAEKSKILKRIYMLALSLSTRYHQRAFGTIENLLRGGFSDKMINRGNKEMSGT